MLYTDAGLEIGVAATKTFTTQLAVLYLLALRIGRIRGACRRRRSAALLEEVRALPQKLTACLEAAPAGRGRATRPRQALLLYLGRHHVGCRRAWRAR